MKTLLTIMLLLTSCQPSLAEPFKGFGDPDYLNDKTPPRLPPPERTWWQEMVHALTPSPARPVHRRCYEVETGNGPYSYLYKVCHHD